MGDLQTRKPSNAMALRKAADFANGVRPFNVQAHFVRQLWAGNGKADKMIVGR
jgi:hypothetical protein